MVKIVQPLRLWGFLWKSHSVAPRDYSTYMNNVFLVLNSVKGLMLLFERFITVSTVVKPNSFRASSSI